MSLNTLPRRRTFGAALAALVCVSGTAACDSEPTKTSSSDNKKSGSASETVESTDGSGSKSGDNKTLNLGMPFTAKAGWSIYTDDAWMLARMGVTETLVKLDPQGSVTPGLAKKAEQTDSKTVVFTLRDGATFHDGSKVTAKAVATSLENAFKADPAPSVVAKRDLEVKADDDKVTITSPKADPVLLQRFADPSLAILGPKAFDRDDKAPTPVEAATGPFSMAKATGDGPLDLKAYSDYWAGKPKLEALKVTFLSKPEARVAGLKAGEQDIVYGLPVSALKNLGDAKVEQTELPRLTMASLNTKKGPFAKEANRIAAAAAINAEEIVEGVYEGNADVASRIFRPKHVGDAGEKVTWKESKVDDVNITIATYSDRAQLPEALTLIGERLKKAGFNVTTAPVKEYSQMEDDIMGGKFDLIVNSRAYLSKASDPVALLKSDYTCKGGYNLAQFCDKTVDAAIAKADDIIDQDDRLKAAADIETTLLETAAVVPLVHDRSRFGLAKSVSGITQDPMEWSLITYKTTK